MRRTLSIALKRVISIARHNSIQFTDWKAERDPKPEVRIRRIAELAAPAADCLKRLTRKKRARLGHIHHPAEIHREIKWTLNVDSRHARFFVDELYVAINKSDVGS